jgi:PAS domain S-box-containing protein
MKKYDGQSRSYAASLGRHYQVIAYSPAPNQFATIFLDITDHRMAEEALRESEEMLRLVATHSPDNIFLQDLDLRYVWMINPVLPFTVEQSVGKTDGELLGQEGARPLTETKRKVIETGVGARIEQSLIIGGRQGYFEAVYEPWRDSEDRVVGLFGYVRDITERKLLEQKLRRAQRMEAAGRVAGLVAHDFNNLLSPLVSYPEILKTELPEGHLVGHST